MPVYRTAPVLPYAASDLFDLVTDIRSYPDFIRWIRSMRVTGERVDDEGIRHCLGEAVVGFSGLTERFATTVAADPQALTVRADLVRGPFRHLHNHWRFVPLGAAQTRVEFAIDYEFRNMVLRLLAKNNFGLAVNRLIGAFTDEAARRYGPPRRVGAG